MAVPKYNEFMKPILVATQDGKNYKMKELRECMAKCFKLSQDDLSAMLPSGLQTVFSNRVQWASTYLIKAGLLERPTRGVVKITKEGLKVVKENPLEINAAYLSKYDSFCKFQSINKKVTDTTLVDTQTPDDTFEESFEQINASLADDLLTEVMKITPVAFEKMIIDLMKKMGYGAFENSGKTTPISGDEGIDGVIMEDKLGFNLIYIQAKHWDRDRTVGRPEIQNFVGAISGKGGNGLFVTTAKYSKTAIEYASQHHVILIDGEKLAKLMIEHNFGVSVKKVFEIKELDSDTFANYDNL